MKIATIRRGTTHTLKCPVASANRTFLSSATVIEMTLTDSMNSANYWTKTGEYSGGNIVFEFTQSDTLSYPYRPLRVQIRALGENGECDSTPVYEIEMLETLSTTLLSIPTTLEEEEVTE